MQQLVPAVTFKPLMARCKHRALGGCRSQACAQVSCGTIIHHCPLQDTGSAPDPLLLEGASWGVRRPLPQPRVLQLSSPRSHHQPSALRLISTAGWQLECRPRRELKEALCPHRGCPQQGVCVQPVSPAFETQAWPCVHNTTVHKWALSFSDS